MRVRLRPAVILSVDQLNRQALGVCFVPITVKQRPDFSVRILSKPEGTASITTVGAKYDQVTTVETRILQYKALGKLPSAKMNSLKSRFELASHSFTEASNVVSSLLVLGVGSEMGREILSLVRNYLE